jgi:adenylate cyclase
MERRLAAILAADVVGYTTLMGADEAGTLRRLTEFRREILEPLIDKHHGRIFKLMGDGLLVQYQSVVDAVECAHAWQEITAKHQAEVENETQLRFRIGINLGDVIVEGDDIHGDGVNIATRLEALARPGGVCVSADAYRQAKGKVKVEFEDLGAQNLKNVADPVHAYSLRLDIPLGDVQKTIIPKRPAVAVLPFDNMSGDPEQEYFSDGLAEDIITALSHWRSFPVIARNSSFSFKGQKVRVQKIADELGARYVLEGSVRKAGQRLRITAQLIDANSGHHVWAERFDRQIEDIFDVQDEITNRIAATIMPELEHFEHRRSANKRTEDLNAWDYYLRGMETIQHETCEGTEASVRMFRLAVDLDATYCDAWARLGWCYARLVMFGCVDDRDATLGLGFEASRRAVALDDGSALAHMALGACHIWAEETQLGLAEAQIALELNPNFAIAGMAVGNRLDLVGETEEGIAQMERSLTLNPRDPNRWRYMAYLSRAYISLGEYQHAADWARKAVLLRPDLPEALFRCAVCVAHLDELDETQALLAKCRAIDPNYLSKMAGWRPYAEEARNEHYLSGLRRHGLLP